MEKSLKTILYLSIVLLTISIGLSCYVLILESQQYEETTYSLSKLGSWGDLFGGFLNPIFSFLALMGLILTIKYQVDELAESRKQFTRTSDAQEKLVITTVRQGFEQSFRNLLELTVSLNSQFEFSERKGDDVSEVSAHCSDFGLG